MKVMLNTGKYMAGVTAVNWRRVCCEEERRTYGRLQEQAEATDSVMNKTTKWYPQWTLADASNSKV